MYMHYGKQEISFEQAINMNGWDDIYVAKSEGEKRTLIERLKTETQKIDEENKRQGEKNHG